MSFTRAWRGESTTWATWLAGRSRLLIGLAAVTLAVSAFGGWQLWHTVTPARTNAAPQIKLPFAAGPAWTIGIEDHATPASGDGHPGCQAGTPVPTCRPPQPGGAGLTFVRADGETADETVLAPASGTIRWLNPAAGSVEIDLGDGYSLDVTTAALDPALTPGQTVRQGQPIGTTTAPTVARSAGHPLIELALWRTDGSATTARQPAPFTGAHALDGHDLPLPGSGETDQERGRTVVSSNEPVAAAGPAVATLKGPASGLRIAVTRTRVTLTWNPMPDATGYRVEINGAAVSPWLTSPIWTTDALGPGQYAWRVRARDESGTGPLSPPWSFHIDATTASSPAGPLALKASVAEAEAGAVIHLTGAGFGGREMVTATWDGQPIATVAAGGNGAFATDVIVPESPSGDHTITARGETSHHATSTGVRVRPSLARGPSSAVPGSPVAVAARGFAARERVRLTWHTADGPALASITTDAHGSGTATITLPDGKPGWNDYTGTGETSKARAWGAIEIRSSLTLSATVAAPGTRIDLTARGVPPGQPVAIAWNRTAGESGTLLCHGTAGADGRFACDFPASGSAGTFPVALTGANELSVATTLTIRGPTAVAITPGASAVGTNVTVALGGFARRESVALSLGDRPWRTVKVDANGTRSLPATVPPRAQGSVTLTARGVSSGHSATTAFRVSATFNAGGGPATVTSGVYRVTATREGLVGETTSTGHVIIPDDRFVALPACLTSNCPWLRAGKDDPIWGVRTECGDKCFVKVVNPVNRTCTVAPVWDVGPWFRSDDWWRPTAERRLNTRLGSPNTLAQGYPGTEAARNGLDVGYGVGPDGHGASDRYADVGNRAAIDLADGTWNDLGLDFERGIAGGIEVQLLWQTGQAPAAAARGCAAAAGGANVRGAQPQTTRTFTAAVAHAGRAAGKWHGKLAGNGPLTGAIDRFVNPVAPDEPGRFDRRVPCSPVSSSRSMAPASPNRRWTRRGRWRH